MKNSINQKSTIGILLLSSVLVAGILIGAIGSNLINNNSTTKLQERYDLIAKRALIENPNDMLLDFANLEAQLENYNNKLPTNKTSIYFEYLPTGTTIGINEKEELAGASLLKTPLAINLYKSAQEGKIDLDKPIALKKEWLNSQYGELYKKGEGYQLTLRQAAQIMLRDSDNTASLAIFNSLAEVIPINKMLLSFIDVDFGVNKDESIRIGAQTYSSILKCLYFTCYTDKDSSQEILGYLTESKFNNRLKLYLPEDTKVAHKIGTYDADGATHIQSDCGIFYITNRNYLLCVMVKGEEDEANRIIGDISKITYDFITKKQY